MNSTELGPSTDLWSLAREGVVNLVRNCLGTVEKESVLLLNEWGKVDNDLVRLMEEVVRECGAECHSLWGEPIQVGRKGLSPVLLGALRSADKTIMNYTIDRVVLYDYVKDHNVIRVNNRCRTPEQMATEHARYHWGMVKAICSRLEEIFSGGKEWRVTSLSGTDIQGKVGSKSEVADAHFVKEAEENRYYRVFPGETYTPVGSVDAYGVVFVDHVAPNDETNWKDLVALRVENNKIIEITGGERAERLRANLKTHEVECGSAAYSLDSWHGGMNPKAKSDPKGIGAISTTERMHFHNRTVSAHFGAHITSQTIELDGMKVYERGSLLLGSDPYLREQAKKYEVNDLI
jgi:hypothetical protein